MAIRYVTAGESHGEMLVGIIDNVPAGLEIDVNQIDRELKRRMSGFGRGKRMNSENDSAHIIAGVMNGISTGAPIAILIKNVDCAYGNKYPDVSDCCGKITAARPGHADLSGAVKYGWSDARNVAERASARTTAMTVALGAVAKRYLKAFGIEIYSHTVSIGSICASRIDDYAQTFALAECDLLHCADSIASKAMTKEIEHAALDGDTLGGVSEIVVIGCKSGIGSFMSYDKRLDGLIMNAVGSVPSVKAVEIGDGIFASSSRGSAVHDKIYPSEIAGKVMRKTNRAGGIEGGMSNGEHIVVRAYFKPIPTLAAALDTVDIESKKAVKAAVVRSDICIVPAGGVVCESAVALALASAVSECLGGDTMSEAMQRYAAKESAV